MCWSSSESLPPGNSRSRDVAITDDPDERHDCAGRTQTRMFDSQTVHGPCQAVHGKSDLRGTTTAAYPWGFAIPAAVGLGAMIGICSPPIANGEARRRGVVLSHRISAAADRTATRIPVGACNPCNVRSACGGWLCSFTACGEAGRPIAGLAAAGCLRDKSARLSLWAVTLRLRPVGLHWEGPPFFHGSFLARSSEGCIGNRTGHRHTFF